METLLIPYGFVYSTSETFICQIDNDADALKCEQELGVKLPQIDYEQNYLLVAIGKEIENCPYYFISRDGNNWARKIPRLQFKEQGQDVEAIFVYKTEPIMLFSEPSGYWFENVNL